MVTVQGSVESNGNISPASMTAREQDDRQLRSGHEGEDLEACVPPCDDKSIATTTATPSATPHIDNVGLSIG